MLLTYFLAMMPSMTAPLVYFSCLAGLLTWLMAAAKGEPASRAPIAVVFMVKAGCGGGWSGGDFLSGLPRAGGGDQRRAQIVAMRHNYNNNADARR